MYPVFCTALTDDYEVTFSFLAFFLSSLTTFIDCLWLFLLQGVRCEVLKLLCQLAASDPEYQVKK
jgi:hypothetical protein